MPRKEKKKKKLAIIQAASLLFVKQGIEQTSLAGIARAVGISKGTLYYYYSSKNDLIFDITAHHMNQITTDLFSLIEQEGAGATSLETVLTALVDTILNAKTRSRLHLYLIQEAMSGNEAIRQRFEKTYREWFLSTTEGFRKIMAGGDDLETVAPILVAVLDGFVIQSMLGVQRIPVNRIVHYLIKMVAIKTISDNSII
ncbi:MAG: TetR/AcrR family transcriptional regulator [Thermodesulfobacteriota bacterium]